MFNKNQNNLLPNSVHINRTSYVLQRVNVLQKQFMLRHICYTVYNTNTGCKQTKTRHYISYTEGRVSLAFCRVWGRPTLFLGVYLTKNILWLGCPSVSGRRIYLTYTFISTHGVIYMAVNVKRQTIRQHLFLFDFYFSSHVLIRGKYQSKNSICSVETIKLLKLI